MTHTESTAETPPPSLESASSSVAHYLQARISEAGMPANLTDAISYSVLSGGKRLRPALTLMCCEAVGGKTEDALAPAAALELIHTFSLVHDDLPAMDDDYLRRGRPTLHVHAGEAMAILAGDAMMSLAFELIAEAEQAGFAPGLLTAELARATTCMIVGQVYDTLGGIPDELNDEQTIRLIHSNKTGALIRAACRMGALCGNAKPSQLDALTRYGEAIGFMFQIVDDLLDITQTAEHAGKATNKDAEAGKLTYPGLFGLERARQTIRTLHRSADHAIEPLGAGADELRRVCEYLAVRTK